MKVLISAYACNPNKGSEPGVGWGFVKALSEHHELWVIVEEERCKLDISLYLDNNPEFSERVHFYFIKKQRNRILRKIWPPSYYIYYRRWHQEAYHLAQKLHEEVGFEIVHQLTMVGFREPSFLYKLGVPFVWGPIGGMGYFPWRFLGKQDVYGKLYFLGYNIFNFFQMHYGQRPMEAAKYAETGLITATPDNQNLAKKYWGIDSIVIPEVGLPCHPKSSYRHREMDQPLKIVWSGIHLRRKALDLALEAISKVSPEVNCELHILGDGTMNSSCRKIAKRLGINNKCRFYGWRKREECLDIFSESHLMLITSLQDLTSTVVIEGIAMGLPIICLDHCGFSFVVDEECGVKIPVTDPFEVVLRIADEISDLAIDEKRRIKMASAALKRAKDFYWKDKADLISKIYKNKRGDFLQEDNS
jgi:glycosyltransferase involved in cell wall biosynthesis